MRALRVKSETVIQDAYGEQLAGGCGRMIAVVMAACMLTFVSAFWAAIMADRSGSTTKVTLSHYYGTSSYQS